MSGSPVGRALQKDGRTPLPGRWWDPQQKKWVVSGVVNVSPGAPSTPPRPRVWFGLANSGYSDELRQILEYRPRIINATSPKTGERITRAQMEQQTKVLQWFENAPVWVWQALDRWRTNAGWRAQFRKVLKQIKMQALRLRIAFYKAPQSVRKTMNFLTVQTPADVNPSIPRGAREMTRGLRPAAKNTFTALWQAMPGGAKTQFYHRRKPRRSFIESVD